MKPIFLILSFGICLNLFAQEIITGPTTLDALIASDHRAWFDKNYQAYQPDISVIQSFPVSEKNISIKIVAGTWCSDSRILLPQFYKVMDMWQFNHQNIELIFTDKNKQVKMKGFRKLRIDYVPTLIFYNSKGKEIGRIIEQSEGTIEKHVLKILSGN